MLPLHYLQVGFIPDDAHSDPRVPQHQLDTLQRDGVRLHEYQGGRETLSPADTRASRSAQA